MYNLSTATATHDNRTYRQGYEEGRQHMARELAEFSISGFLLLLFALIALLCLHF